MADTQQIKTMVKERIDGAAGQLTELSHDIWANPELAFEEHHAAEACAKVLGNAGFTVTLGVGDLPTAFTAEYGSGSLTVAICSELDALPGVGHACGHNMIAAAGVGAGIGLTAVADELDLTVRVVGTPAEEGGGGKIILLERGVFDGVHFSMMVHPSPTERDTINPLATTSFEYRFSGHPAHASAAPHKGINAADAVTVAQVAIGLLRQHLPPGDQVHGIVIDGGDATNIVPHRAAAKFQVRSPSVSSLRELVPRIHACFEAGALATGATLEIVSTRIPYTEFEHDDTLIGLYRANAEAIGRTFAPPESGGGGSTDMANLSLMMPTIHPMLGLESNGAVNHQVEFADLCRTPEADKATLDGALAMAWTTVDAALDPALRERYLAGDTGYGHRPDYPWTLDG
ncbi:MAG: M20 family metallopeptidase [Acidimicrobiia bacterium]|nr:M20 family metallopeptidase [Acidimicrobiia bacterium]